MIIKLTNGNTHYINKLDDFKEVVETEVYEAIEEIYNNGNEPNLREQYESLQQEFESYEASNDSYYSCLNDTLNAIDELEEYITDSKRIHKDKILKTLSNIRENIYNEI